MRLLVKEKNADEVVQQFFYHTSGAQLQGASAVDAPISEQEARKDGEEGQLHYTNQMRTKYSQFILALQHLRTLLHLLLTNSVSGQIFG